MSFEVRKAFRTTVMAAVIVCSCARQPEESAPAKGLYGDLKATPSTAIAPARPHQSAGEDWKNAPFFVLQSDLTPLTVFHTSDEYVGLFAGLNDYGLGAPSHVAYSTEEGPQIGGHGQVLQTGLMRENWLLVWFAGSEGWADWDSPWAVFLQRRPYFMRLDADGLHIFFREPAGTFVMMPFFGCYKPPQRDRQVLTGQGLAEHNVRTWEWAEFLRRETLQRVRYWAGVSRAVPIYCEETFRVDRSTDSVTIRQRMEWHAIQDEWGTKPFKVAPVSPVLALAAREEVFPARFSRTTVDLELATPAGPYTGVQRRDELEVRLNLLQYAHETAAHQQPDIEAHPGVAAALDLLQRTMREASDQTEWVWNEREAVWFARALPFCSEPARARIAAKLREFWSERLAREPALPGWLEGLWALSHFTDDWSLVSEHWPAIRETISSMAQGHWPGFGREEISALGEQAPPVAALARLAYKTGDADTYYYACYLLARELTHHFVKQRATQYFREHQPWHSMEPIGSGTFPVQLRSGLDGWALAQPALGRWSHFHSPDIARFYRDFARNDVHRELNLMREQATTEDLARNLPDERPSLLQLHSMLLNTPPDQLAALATPGAFSGTPAEILADCIAVLRASRPDRHERLIPSARPTPFLTGIERDVAGPSSELTHRIEVRDKDGRAIWPRIELGGDWRTPADAPWNVGHVRLARAREPSVAQVVPINWNSRVLVFE